MRLLPQACAASGLGNFFACTRGTPPSSPRSEEEYRFLDHFAAGSGTRSVAANQSLVRIGIMGVGRPRPMSVPFD